MAFRCPYCRGRLGYVVDKRWEFTIAFRVPTLNEIKLLHPHRYKKLRDDWTLLWKSERNQHKIVLPLSTRRIYFTRIFGRGKREYDYDNLVGGMKPIVDAAIVAGIIIDDKDRWLEAHYKQERGAVDALHVVIEELIEPSEIESADG